MKKLFDSLRLLLFASLLAAFSTVSVSSRALADNTEALLMLQANPSDLQIPVVPPIYMPEISRALRQTPPPKAGAFDVEINWGLRDWNRLRKLISYHRAMPVYPNGYADVPVILVTSGVASLQDLAEHPVTGEYLTCSENDCALKIPLMVTEDATIVVDKVNLGMAQKTGALIGGSGNIYIRHSVVRTTFDPEYKKDPHYKKVRPFITGLAGSYMTLIGSSFYDLGFHGSNAYGISISARRGQEEPSGMIVGNVFEGLYYGFYSHHAKEITIADNLYRDNIIYGVDPHDYSHHLWIIGNHAYGTHKKHGIIISRGVTDSVIAMNRSHHNGNAGIMLDRHCSRNIVSHNHTYKNGYDGIAIYESSENLIVHNLSEANNKSGLRIRNSGDLRVAHNEFSANQTGIVGYTGAPNGFTRKKEDIYRLGVDASFVENTVQYNLRNDFTVDGCITKLVFAQSLNNQPGFTRPDVRFGGAKIWKRFFRTERSRLYGDVEITSNCHAPFVYPVGKKK